MWPTWKELGRFVVAAIALLVFINVMFAVLALNGWVMVLVLRYFGILPE